MPHVLFDREREVLEFIVQFIQRFGYAPTLREVCKGVGVTSPATVCEHIYKLEDKGFLKRIPGKRRGIEITERATKVAGSDGATEIPIMGFIAAGEPLQPHTDPNAYIMIANTMITNGKAAYILQVKGQSMKDDGIMEGDYVLVQHQAEAKSGDLVVAVLPSGFATLKRIFFEENRIRLQPANSEMSPIYTTEVKIQGKIIGVIRKYAS